MIAICGMLWLSMDARAQIPIAAVTASSHQEPNRPQNTLAMDTTRWSAQGDGQWIQYEFPGSSWNVCGVFLQWYRSAERNAQFEVQVSADGSAWTTVFAGETFLGQGLFFYDFPPEIGPCPGPARYARIVGHGAIYAKTKKKETWNSLEFAQFIGWPNVGVRPRVNAYNIFVSGASTSFAEPMISEGNDPWWIQAWGPNPFPFSASYLIPAGTSIDVTMEFSEDGSIPIHAECMAVQWDEPGVPFTLDVIDVATSTTTQLVNATADESAFSIYPLTPAQDYVGWDTRIFRLTPAVDAHLAELLFLIDCNDQPGQFYAASVAATAFDKRGAYHAPGNAIDGNPNTRWSAQGDEQTIEFELITAPYYGVGIHWHQGTTRIAFFDVEMSIDGTEWFPVMRNSASWQIGDLEWYAFGQPAYGGMLRIIGHGNSVQGAKGWTSISEVIFENRQPQVVAQE